MPISHRLMTRWGLGQMGARFLPPFTRPSSRSRAHSPSSTTTTISHPLSSSASALPFTNISLPHDLTDEADIGRIVRALKKPFKSTVHFRYRTDPPPKEAAVLVPLCQVAGVPSLLFTLRTSHLNSHQGEIR